MDNTMTGGERFLQGLILRAEDVLTKMFCKMHYTVVPLEEMVPWINSVYAFVNAWEEPLRDVKIDQLKLDAAASGKRLAEDALIEEVNNDLNVGKETQDMGTPAECKLLAKERIEEAEPVFEFLERSLKDYQMYKTGRCVISSLGTASRTFCMVDRDNHDCTKLIAALQNCRGMLLAHLPQADQVFGIFLDGSLFRAVRNKPDAALNFAYVRLLDTGEILPYEETMKLCSLSDYYQKLPAFAVRCILVNILDDPFCDDLDRYLVNALHNDQYYKVVSVEGSILFLKLSQQPIEVTTKPSCNESSPDLTPIKATRVQPAKSEPIVSRIALFKPNQQSPSGSAHNVRLPTKTVNKTQPICPFSFSSWGLKRAKGVYSKIEPTSCSSPETSTEEPYRYFRNDLPDELLGVGDKKQRVVPPIGIKLYLVAKFIKDVEHFWCHVVSPDSADTDLMEMELKLNSPESWIHYRKLKEPPIFRQRVFAKYSDKRWYRAEVAEYFDQQNVLVFYVDYGNAELVRMDEMCEWDDQFSYLPYQAVLCRLANVCRVKPHHKPAIVEMNRTLLNQRVLAKIENNGTPWEVTIYDKDGFDFSIALLLAGLAKKREEDVSDTTTSLTSTDFEGIPDSDEDEDEMRIPVINST